MFFRLLTIVVYLSGFTFPVFARAKGQDDYYVAISLFVLANLIPQENEPHFYQFNLGLNLSPIDRIGIEAITWRYSSPLGIPYGKDFESEQFRYPGHIQEYGIGIAYQRMLWKGLYSR